MKSKKKEKTKSLYVPEDLGITSTDEMGLFPEDIPFTRNLGCAKNDKPKKPKTEK